ncbi:MAG: hypothetical protein LCH76_11140 [Actinobacteria bacterium]|nr:hypothetical protein [Actinomycetota bacterium]
MKLDIAAFGLGAVAVMVGGLALWASSMAVDWAWVSRAAPIALVVVGIAMLVLSRIRTH